MSITGVSMGYSRRNPVLVPSFHSSLFAGSMTADSALWLLSPQETSPQCLPAVHVKGNCNSTASAWAQSVTVWYTRVGPRAGWGRNFQRRVYLQLQVTGTHKTNFLSLETLYSMYRGSKVCVPGQQRGQLPCLQSG